jgi:hypothetical protein
MTHEMQHRSFWCVAKAFTALTLLSSASCAEPKQDDFKSQGGISPDPTGIIEGSLVYLGPQPRCEYEAGKATKIIGNALLTLFVYDNPPPPEGTATGAVNAFVLKGSDIFSLGDCLAEGVEPDPTRRIMRSTPFRWPQITLTKTAVDYQIRGFYDHDGDMNPRFSATNLPTAGDIVGQALKDVEQPQLGPERLRFRAADNARDGQLVSGVTVTLGAYAWLERPMFQLSQDARVLDANAVVPVSPGGLNDKGEAIPNVATTLLNTFKLTCRDSSPADDCGTYIEALDPAAASGAFEAAGLAPIFDAERYAFLASDVDVRDIVVGGPDLVRPDGVPDPHPILGASLGVTWTSPMVIMSRRPVIAPDKLDLASLARAAEISTRAKIPSVSIVGTVLPEDTATKKVFVDRMRLAVAPVAAVTLSSVSPACRVVYANPGNTTNTLEARVVHCGKLPTGLYGTNVLSGAAGGARVAEPNADVSESGFVYSGARFSGQVWSVPNELGDQGQIGDSALASQSPAGAFYIGDKSPDKLAGDCKEAGDPKMGLPLKTRPVEYKGICKEGESPFAELAPTFAEPVGVDGGNCLPDICCDAIRHLCNVPLCEVIDVNGVQMRADPSEITAEVTTKVDADGNGENDVAGVPNCIPFELPSLCCPKD